MRRRSTKRKTSAADLLVTQEPKTAAAPIKSESKSPKGFEFNFHKRKSSSSVKNENDGSGGGGAKSLMFMQPTGEFTPLKGVNTISDVKDFASSGMQSIKRQLDRSHSEIMKDIEASHSRLQKRFKMQSQGCQQMMDEAEKEFKKLSDRIGESQEAMKVSFTKFNVEMLSCAALLCKTSIAEMHQSFEKSLNALRIHYGISETSPS